MDDAKASVSVLRSKEAVEMLKVTNDQHGPSTSHSLLAFGGMINQLPSLKDVTNFKSSLGSPSFHFVVCLLQRWFGR